MFPLTSCLVLACVGAVAINAEQLLTEACMKVRNGSTTGAQTPLRPIIVPQGQSEWFMFMPFSECPGATNGITAMACDVDAIPSVEFIKSKALIVQRNGNLKGDAVVTITFYCSEPRGNVS